jgi:hypothetical protein
MHLPKQILSLLTNNENLKDTKVVANAFSTFFLTVADSLNLHQGGRDCAVSLLKDAFSERFPEIKSIIHSLKSKNSSGYDEVTRILKSFSSLISHPLSHICKHSLHPVCLKISAVKLVYKKSDGANMTNYRPVALLTTFSEVLEVIIYSR